jgi:hypothetical protein
MVDPPPGIAVDVARAATLYALAARAFAEPQGATAARFYSVEVENPRPGERGADRVRFESAVHVSPRGARVILVSPRAGVPARLAYRRWSPRGPWAGLSVNHGAHATAAYRPEQPRSGLFWECWGSLQIPVGERRSHKRSTNLRAVFHRFVGS